MCRCLQTTELRLLLATGSVLSRLNNHLSHNQSHKHTFYQYANGHIKNYDARGAGRLAMCARSFDWMCGWFHCSSAVWIELPMLQAIGHPVHHSTTFSALGWRERGVCSCGCDSYVDIGGIGLWLCLCWLAVLQQIQKETPRRHSDSEGGGIRQSRLSPYRPEKGESGCRARGSSLR
mmetsp:Transcript_5784/g.11825  ORF Transcript_5784/g.11825 Transcript_5784/m.11825 type:complete len:177 (+) Transcript_5784:363-893(+)